MIELTQQQKNDLLRFSGIVAGSYVLYKVLTSRKSPIQTVTEKVAEVPKKIVKKTIETPAKIVKKVVDIPEKIVKTPSKTDRSNKKMNKCSRFVKGSKEAKDYMAKLADIRRVKIAERKKSKK